MATIQSVIREFQFFAQPKYRIASASPGSGNTKNIGSIKDIKKLIAGQGPFADLGEEIYDDYWMYYLTGDMARKLEIPRAYTNLKTYNEYKQRGVETLKAHQDEIMLIDEDEAHDPDGEID